MVCSVPTLVSYLSECMTLLPGTVIMTGTPGGVGNARVPPVLLTPGDVCEVEIEGIGTLRNTVVYSCENMLNTDKFYSFLVRATADATMVLVQTAVPLLALKYGASPIMLGAMGWAPMVLRLAFSLAATVTIYYVTHKRPVFDT